MGSRTIITLLLFILFSVMFFIDSACMRIFLRLQLTGQCDAEKALNNCANDSAAIRLTLRNERPRTLAARTSLRSVRSCDPPNLHQQGRTSSSLNP